MNQPNMDSGFYLLRGIKKMNEALRRIPPISTGSNDPDILIAELSALKEEIGNAAREGLTDMEKGLELDPGSFETESLVKEGVSNLHDIELLDVFAAIEYDKLEYALEELSRIMKGNRDHRKAGELYDEVRSCFCWFCRGKSRIERPSPASSLKIPLHRTVDREDTRTRWEKLEIAIPRCTVCESFHKHDYRIGAGAGLMVGLLINAAAGLYAGNFNILYFLAVNLITTAAGTMFHSIWSGISRLSSHPLKHRELFPPLLKRELEGWNSGGDPQGIAGYPVSRGGGF